MDLRETGRDNLAAVNALLTTPGRGFGTRITVIKAAIACTLSYVIAETIGPEQLAVFAPLVALFTVQASAYATLAQGVQRVLGTVVGVLLATLWLEVAGVTWWSVGVAVVLAVSAAQLLPLSFAAQAQIPIAVLLVLLLGAAIPDYPYWRVVDAAIGGAIGIAVGLLIPERPTTQEAVHACGRWVDGLAELLTSMADEVSLQASPLPEGTVHAFVLKSRALYPIAAAGRAAVESAQESVAFNPRARRERETVEELRRVERWLVRLTLEARVLGVTVDQMYDRVERHPRLTRDDLARLLSALAALLRARQSGRDVSADSEALALDLSRTVDVVSATPSSDRIPLASISLLGRLDQLRQEITDPALGPALT
jgi:uncharacterized membrane protein YgaE (UPF0421/DUF939 family)